MSGFRLFLLCAVVILTAAGCGYLRNSNNDVSNINNNVSFEGVLSQKITPPEPYSSDIRLFGSSVAISGDYAVVGGMNGLFEAVAYVFHRTGTDTWNDGAKIIEAPSYGMPMDVAISSDYAIVGTVYEAGAYVFHRMDINTWDSGTKLDPPDAQEGGGFGNSVSISGDYAIIGALYEGGGEGDTLIKAGAAYLFRRTDVNTWDSGMKIASSDAQNNGQFGGSIATSGGDVIVGAPSAGAAYIFK